MGKLCFSPGKYGRCFGPVVHNDNVIFVILKWISMNRMIFDDLSFRTTVNLTNLMDF